MQTGIVSSENLAQVLRGISQKRQNGALQISQLDQKIQIFFLNGKMVDAGIEGQPSVSQSAGEAGGMDPKLYLKFRLLDFLFNLDLSVSCIYEVKNFIPDLDRDSLPSISVGQYLLDRAALEAESRRFEETFPQNSKIIKLELAGLELSEEEKLFYDSLPETILLRELLDKRAFSRYHLVVYLLSFYDRALVEVEKEAAVEGSGALKQELINALEDQSDRPFVERELKPQAARADITEPKIKKKQGSTATSAAHKKVEQARVSARELNYTFIFSSIYLLLAVAIILSWGQYLNGF